VDQVAEVRQSVPLYGTQPFEDERTDSWDKCAREKRVAQKAVRHSGNPFDPSQQPAGLSRGDGDFSNPIQVTKREENKPDFFDPAHRGNQEHCHPPT
jgi:hypothetical protein